MSFVFLSRNLYRVYFIVSLNTTAAISCPTRCRLSVWCSSHAQGRNRMDTCNFFIGVNV